MKFSYVCRWLLLTGLALPMGANAASYNVFAGWWDSGYWWWEQKESTKFFNSVEEFAEHCRLVAKGNDSNTKVEVGFWESNVAYPCNGCEGSRATVIANSFPKNMPQLTCYRWGTIGADDMWHRQTIASPYWIGTPIDISPAPQHCVGNPLAVESGAKYQSQLDYRDTRNPLLWFERIYNSHSAAATVAARVESALASSTDQTEFPSKMILPQVLGSHWRMNYERAVVYHETMYRDAFNRPHYVISVDVHRPNGQIILFRPDSSGNFKSQTTFDIRLAQLRDEAGQPVGWKVTTDAGLEETYDEAGRLGRMRDQAGNEVVLGHDANSRLATVTDASGRSLEFIYDGGGRIESVLDPEGRAHVYTYEGSMLSSVTRPDSSPESSLDNPRVRYHYEDARFPHALTGITDERGIRYATWSYDSEGRAISSEHGDGADLHTLTYNADGSTTVTNPLGKQTTYHFTTLRGVRKVTQVEGHPTASCVSANKAYTYTPEGWVDTQTDWKGNLTDFDYDSRGLVTQKVEGKGTPAQRITLTEWHPTLRLPVKLTEPQQITTLSYDDKGRLLSRQVQPR